MKFILVAFALIGLAAALPNKSVESDIHDFLDLLPLAQIKAIVLKYYENDPDVQKAFAYLSGPEYIALMQEVVSKDAVKAFNAILLEAGFDVLAIVRYLQELIDNTREFKNIPMTRGMREMYDEIVAVLPLGDMVAMLNDKLTNSPDFQRFYAIMSTRKAQDVFEEIRAIPEVQRVAERLREQGIDLTKAVDSIYAFFGWN